MSAPGWPWLAGLLAVAGATHLLAPARYEPIVPRRLGAPRPWVLASGLAELACALGLTHPRSRAGAARASAGLFVAVFPANVQMAVTALRSPRASAGYRAFTLGRLPLQVPLVRWAWRVAGSAR
jgi:uncharacterized membrane protein